MIDVVQSLDSISSTYSVFERDQVLTHEQLNSVARYLDDQDRLTRVYLVGIGNVCGMRVSVSGDRVKVTKGLAMTTDGDLLRFIEDTPFNRFKKYGASAPKYAPFNVGEQMITAFELIAVGPDDAGAIPLSRFKAQTGLDLSSMVVVLYVESYEKDKDVCSDADCDNRGKEAVNVVRLLLVEKSVASRLKANVETLADVARTFDEVPVTRPVVSKSIGSYAALARAYQTACTTIDGALRKALAKVYPACAFFTADIFASDPTGGWKGKLDQAALSVSDSRLGIQYYYDFLKDLAETYHALRDCLFEDSSVCCPDLGAFPKHVLLGSLDGRTGEHRTGFYPSPLGRSCCPTLEHARSLIRKLDAMISAFTVTVDRAMEIRITPSLFEDRSLEERAIPFYYKVTEASAMLDAWSYASTKRGRQKYAYSYHAGEYHAAGGALTPLDVGIGGMSFFRIEGHLDQDVTSVITALEKKIKSKNLPFCVRAVMLGTKKSKLVKPAIRYSDLHRMHFLLRQDAAHQLEEVKSYNDGFVAKVKLAVEHKVFGDETDEVDGKTIERTIDAKGKDVRDSASAAQAKLNLRYAAFSAVPAWQEDTKKTITQASELKAELGKVVKTEFVTPVDSIISSTHIQWIDWLGRIIQKKEETADDHLLFSSFVDRHPGLEHFGGVIRGGSFVLVYDEANKVIADFMLPCCCCGDEVEEPDPETPLTKPAVRPESVISNGVTLNPTLGKTLRNKMEEVKIQLGEKIATQNQYFDVFKRSVEVITAATQPKGRGPIDPGIFEAVVDPNLNRMMGDIRMLTAKVDELQSGLRVPSLDAGEREQIETEIDTREKALSTAVVEAGEYVAKSKVDVSAGSDGSKVMTAIAMGMGKISGEETLKKTGVALSAATKDGPSDVKAVIGSVLKERGLVKRSFENTDLEGRVIEIDSRAAEVEELRNRLLVHTLEGRARVAAERELDVAESNLVEAVRSTSAFVADHNLDVSEGTEGFKAMTAVATGLDKIGTPAKLNKAGMDLDAAVKSGGPEVRTLVGSMLKARGLSIERFTDTQLDTLVKNIEARVAAVDTVRRRILAPSPARGVAPDLTINLVAEEKELAKAVHDSVKYIADNRIDVRPDSDGFRAMAVAASGLQKISRDLVRAEARRSLEAVSNATRDTNVKKLISGMITGSIG